MTGASGAGTPGGAAGGSAALPLWEQYDPADGGFKALVMDVDGAALRFSVLRDSPTLAAIRAQAPAGVENADMGLLKELEE